MPLKLTKRDAKRLTHNRTMLQPPAPGAVPLNLDAFKAEGLPGDVIFALEALRQLAEQGNQIALNLYVRERARLGIGDRKVFVLARP